MSTTFADDTLTVVPLRGKGSMIVEEVSCKEMNLFRIKFLDLMVGEVLFEGKYVAAGSMDHIRIGVYSCPFWKKMLYLEEDKIFLKKPFNVHQYNKFEEKVLQWFVLAAEWERVRLIMNKLFFIPDSAIDHTVRMTRLGILTKNAISIRNALIEHWNGIQKLIETTAVPRGPSSSSSSEDN